MGRSPQMCAHGSHAHCRYAAIDSPRTREGEWMGLRHKTLRTATALIAVACLHAPAMAQDAPALAELEASESATAETCEADQPAPVEYVLPTTGKIWTFPAGATDAATECAPPPPPVRPTAPNLFRMAALPIGNMPALQKWERARAGGLAD